MEPCFSTLFSRSRYGRRVALAPQGNDEDSTEERKTLERNESERFAVAAIAFCLHHDSAFQRHYVETICRGPDPAIISDLAKPKIVVEGKHCADLLLEGAKYALIVEHKIHAPLAPHQDPTNPDFRSRTKHPRGYAVQLREAHPGKRILYVVLGRIFEPLRVEEIECRSVMWEGLQQPIELETALERDLYDCLGSLGVSSLALRYMPKDSKLATHAKGAAEIFEMLGRVCDTVGLKRGPMAESDTGYAPTDYSFGVPLLIGRSEASRNAPIRKLLNSPSSTIGWCGCEMAKGDENASLLLSLECGGREAVERVLKRLQRFGDSVRDDGLEVRVVCPAEKSSGDEQWFTDVLKSLTG